MGLSNNAVMSVSHDAGRKGRAAFVRTPPGRQGDLQRMLKLPHMTDSGEVSMEDEEAELLEFAESIVIDAIEGDVQVADLQEVITLLERLQAADTPEAMLALAAEAPVELRALLVAPTLLATFELPGRDTVGVWLSALALLIGIHTELASQHAAAIAHQDAQAQIAVERQIRNELRQRAPDIARKAIEQAKRDSPPPHDSGP
jgi:hypothetical protein